MSNLKNNPIPIFNLRRQSTLEKFDLLALVLTLKEINTKNVLFFINYITINKQAEGLLFIKIEI